HAGRPYTAAGTALRRHHLAEEALEHAVEVGAGPVAGRTTGNDLGSHICILLLATCLMRPIPGHLPTYRAYLFSLSLTSVNSASTTLPSSCASAPCAPAACASPPASLYMYSASL